MTRVRTAQHLWFSFRGGSVVGCNPFVGATRSLPGPIFQFLQSMTSWIEEAESIRNFSNLVAHQDSASTILGTLGSEGFLVREGSKLAFEEERFTDEWMFGESTALHHLAMRNIQFSDDRTEAVNLAKKLKERANHQTEAGRSKPGTGIELPEHALSPQLHGVLSRRRTRRDFVDEPVSLIQLATVLWAGAGHQGNANPRFRPNVPLMYSPSAGGLDGVELYAIVRNVDGISPGTYRYSPQFGRLVQVAPWRATDVRHLVGNQRWGDTCGTVIVLVGDTRRIGWKYNAASGFNALQLQAGHMSQTMLLAIADLGLGSVPSNALHVRDVEHTLELEVGRHVVLQAIGLGNVSALASSYEAYGHSDMELLGRMTEHAS